MGAGALIVVPVPDSPSLSCKTPHKRQRSSLFCFASHAELQGGPWTGRNPQFARWESCHRPKETQQACRPSLRILSPSDGSKSSQWAHAHGHNVPLVLRDPITSASHTHTHCFVLVTQALLKKKKPCPSKTLTVLYKCIMCACLCE